MADTDIVSPQGYKLGNTQHPFWEMDEPGGTGILGVGYDVETDGDYTLFKWYEVDRDGNKVPIGTQRINTEGQPGPKGDPGFSPVISVIPAEFGHVVKIQTEEGIQEFSVADGKDGKSAETYIVTSDGYIVDPNLKVQTIELNENDTVLVYFRYEYAGTDTQSQFIPIPDSAFLPTRISGDGYLGMFSYALAYGHIFALSTNGNSVGYGNLIQEFASIEGTFSFKVFPSTTVNPGGLKGTLRLNGGSITILRAGSL